MRSFLRTRIRIFIVIVLLFSAPTLLAQQKADTASWPGNAAINKRLTESQPASISNDIFSRGVVKYEELVQRANSHPYMPGEIIVAIEYSLAKNNVSAALAQINWAEVFTANNVVPHTLMIKQKSPSYSVALVHLKLPPNTNVFSAMRIVNARPNVIWSSPNFYYPGNPRDIVPNDPSYGLQYHHGLMDNDLAWNTTFGNASVTIGITDDGVDLLHEDLAPNIWTNPGEIAGNGIDDDGNGYIDDVHGWDFSNVNNDPSPEGTNNHGTHVAGIAAARTNNGIGVAGVAGQCTIVPLQFYGDINPWTAALINETYSYAADNGVKILSTSYNVDGFVGDPVFEAALDYMYAAGILHFNSAGNSNAANPPRQVYTHSLFVASTTSTDTKSSFSNYGTGIDIAAPGTDILSTVPSNDYVTFSGTSMATPNASGAAALIWSAFPTWTREQVAAALLANADNIDALNPAYAGLLGTGRVNTFKAINNPLPAPQVKTITGLPAEGGSVLASALGNITIQFNQLLDPAAANTITNYRLLSAGSNGLFGDGDDVNIPVTTSEIYRVGTNMQNFQINNTALPCGNYRFILVSGGLKNPFNTSLDGNADGTGGDNYVRNFSVGSLYYADNDGDGYGSGAAVSLCPPGAGFVLLNGDCDDNNNAIHPGATEICNNIDDNCDGVIDIVGFPLSTPQTFTSTAVINIPASGSGSATGAPADPYPSTINVSGFTTQAGKILVRLNQFSHTFPSDVDILLVGPGGQKFILMSDVGGSNPAIGANIVFDDDAATQVPATIVSGTFKPTNGGTGDLFPAPAPAAPYQSPATAGTATLLSTFNGIPNGTWALYAVDDISGDLGTINGWELTLYPLTDLCSVVPLTLLSFKVIEENDMSAKLQWKTSGEYNTHSFELLESTDGVSYKTIAVVPAVGLGDNSYLQKVNLPAAVNYYRLKMIDKDRQYKNSDVVVIRRKNGNVHITENPVRDYLSIVSYNRQPLSLYNSNGQLLKTFITQGTIEKMDVRNYAAGVYYLKGNGVMLKFVIAR
ncbi:MAG: S8 family serine peptidase [Ferruginibacter sp.]